MVIIVNLLLGSLCASGQKQEYNILLLHSYHEAFQWSSDINRAIERETSIYNDIRTFTEYMDTKKIESPHYFEILKELYKVKYNKGFFDAIICSDNSALNFIIDYGEEIWGKIPVTFCGINEPDKYRQYVDTTLINGVGENIDIKSNINIAKKIIPNLDEIIFITDSTLTGSILMTSAIEDSAPFKHRFIYLDQADIFSNEIKSIDFNNKLIFVLSLFSRRSNISNELTKEYIYHLNKIENRVIMGPWDFFLNNLAIGGRVIKGDDQGSTAARLMIRKLKTNGFVPPFITHNSYVWMADEQVCEALKIPKSKFPPETKWINPKISWFKANESILIFTLGMVSAGFVITLLFVSIIRKKNKAEKERNKGRMLLDVALDAAKAGLWDVNIMTKHFYVSEKLVHLLGYNNIKDYKAEFGSWQENMDQNDLKGLKDIIDDIKEQHSSHFSKEIKIKNAQGIYEWFMVFGKISQWSKNLSPIQISGIIINISERKEVEEQLKLSKEKAEKSDKLKSAFLANMSHEIRTPMNAIIGFTEILMGLDNIDYEKKQYLEIIKSSGDTLLNLINDIIDLSKIESGYLTFNYEQFNLEKLVCPIKNIILNQINNSSKSIEFLITCPPELIEMEISSDPHRLKQILLNLLTNSVKFTEKGSIELRIEKLDKHIVFCIKDTGVGIPSESLPFIYDRFRQHDESIFKIYGGTGLGLSITKNLVTLMKGTIEVESEENIGTTFTVTLPLYYHLQ